MEDTNLEKKFKDNYNALLESSSMVSHDISGQLHLLNFCAEELAEQMGEGNNFLDRMLLGLEGLNEIILNYRQFIKEDKFKSNSLSFDEVVNKALSYFYLHQWNDRKRINIKLEGDSDSKMDECHSMALVEVLFSLICFANEEYKRKEIHSGKLTLSLIKFDTETAEFKILCEALDSNAEDFEKFCHESQKGQKVFRKLLGVEHIVADLNHKFNLEEVSQGLMLYHKYQP